MLNSQRISSISTAQGVPPIALNSASMALNVPKRQFTLFAKRGISKHYKVEFEISGGALRAVCECPRAKTWLCRHYFALMRGESKMLFDSAQRPEYDRLQSLPEFQALKTETENSLTELERLRSRIKEDDSRFDEWYWSLWDAKHPNAKPTISHRIDNDGTWEQPAVQGKFKRLKLKQAKVSKSIERLRDGLFQLVRGPQSIL